MFLWWSINIILLIIIFFLLLLLSMFWPPDSPWAPWWRTNKRTARAMCRLAKISKKDVIYDLGSGTGTLLLIAAKEFGARGVGIEIDPLRAVISTLALHSAKVRDKIIIKKKNFFNVDLSNATVIFVYLVPKALERLKPKFLKELKPGTRVVSYRYKISLPLSSYDRANNIYLYKINNT
ncbi:MAG: class I SAM-dependent methyltransferase [Candidatus Levybacteria bacterium]|nr:class I SAM-dependent methyltransferase [Candidatus Levybacteria bacterium]